MGRQRTLVFLTALLLATGCGREESTSIQPTVKSTKSNSPPSPPPPAPPPRSISPEKPLVSHAKQKPVVVSQPASKTSEVRPSREAQQPQAFVEELQAKEVMQQKTLESSEETQSPIPIVPDPPRQDSVRPLNANMKKILQETEARCKELETKYLPKINALDRRITANQRKLSSPKLAGAAKAITEKEIERLTRSRTAMEQQLSDDTQQERRKAHEESGEDSPYAFYKDMLIPRTERDKIELSEQNARRRREHDMEVERQEHGTPRQVADNYVADLLNKGILRAATFVAERNDLISGCMNIGQVADWPERVRSVHYQVNYISEAGLVNEREAYVILYKAKNGLWYVSTDTQMETMNH